MSEMASSGRAISLWTVLVAVGALCVITVVVSAAGARPAAAPLVTLTIWFIGVSAYRATALPPDAGLNHSSFWSWALASAAGLLVYFGLDLLAAAVFQASMLSTGLLLGFAANVVGVLVATFGGRLLVQRCRVSSAAPLHRSNPGRPRAQQPFERAPAPAKAHRARHEALWLLGSVAVFAGLAAVMESAAIAPRWPEGVEWPIGVAGVYALLSALRLSVWAISGGARTFQYWPEVGIVVGVCLLAYGALGVIDEYGDDSDRYVATLGAGLSAGSAIARRRTPHRA